MQVRVVIIDTDAAVLKTVHEYFSSAGGTFVCAPGEYEALVALAGPPPTHIILDPRNRNINSLDLINRLAALPYRPGLILMSSENFRLLEAIKQAALNKGLRIVCTARKPVSVHELAELLANTRDAFPDRPTQHATPTPVAISDIQNAIRHDRIEFVYQPRIDCRKGVLCGFEALARWQDIPPRDFLAAAEDNGLMRMLMRRLAAKGIRWLGKYFPHSHYKLSINLSAASIEDTGMPEYLAVVCRHFQLETSRIILEVGERAIENNAVALEQITRLRLKGFHVALHDAGAGHASFEQLLKLPFSELEIDRTFVRRVAVSKECREIVDAMIQMGHRMELLVTGKGVESEEALTYLVEHDCDQAQGYFIAHPLAPQAAAEWRRSPGARMDS